MRASALQTDPEMKRQAGAAAVGQQDGNGLLEPCAVKVACTVLRGGRGSNAPPLPEPSDPRVMISPHPLIVDKGREAIVELGWISWSRGKPMKQELRAAAS